MSDMRDRAVDELHRAGFYDADSDYGGMLGKAVEELLDVFYSQDHSGYSAGVTTELFYRLAKGETLTPITDDPNEWHDCSEVTGTSMWQNRRNSALFSDDGGKTYWNVDDENLGVFHSEPAVEGSS